MVIKSYLMEEKGEKTTLASGNSRVIAGKQATENLEIAPDHSRQVFCALNGFAFRTARCEVNQGLH